MKGVTSQSTNKVKKKDVKKKDVKKKEVKKKDVKKKEVKVKPDPSLKNRTCNIDKGIHRGNDTHNNKKLSYSKQLKSTAFLLKFRDITVEGNLNTKMPLVMGNHLVKVKNQLTQIIISSHISFARISQLIPEMISRNLDQLYFITGENNFKNKTYENHISMKDLIRKINDNKDNMGSSNPIFSHIPLLEKHRIIKKKPTNFNKAVGKNSIYDYIDITKEQAEDITNMYTLDIYIDYKTLKKRIDEQKMLANHKKCIKIIL